MRETVNFYEVAATFEGDWTYKPTLALAEKVGHLSGSYLVLPSRAFGLSYLNYNKFLKTKCGADLSFGKGHYIGVSFKKKKDCEAVTKEINRRLSFLFDGMKVGE